MTARSASTADAGLAAPSALQHDAPHCLYTQTAVSPAPTPPLERDVRVEVGIVGGGYTGLSAALHLAERGRTVALVEAREPGWGAAGRNGGQVNAGLKHEPDEIERDLGPVHGPRLVRLASSAPARLFDLVYRLRIDCEASRAGTLRAAYGPAPAAALRGSVEQWRRRGVGLELWDAAQVEAATGTRRYRAAIFDNRGGSVNPLSLVRGLAAAALNAGAAIHGSTAALALERDGSGWCIATATGYVRADKVVLATDGYSDDLWPRLRQSIVPIFSSIVATRPLPPGLAAAILPHGEVVYESGNITVYYRRDRDGRLLMGGRGRQRSSRDIRDYRHLVRYAEKLWPSHAGIAWTHWWNGQFALTPDYYPRLHAPAPGLYIALGYSGRGVALATAIGAELADATTGTPLDELTLPVVPVRGIALHRLWRARVAARVAWGRVRDRLGV